ncbi:hypothetical protein AC578_2851 [Pseudocercospora eumusae]|uniref:Uncharacterized protein n=1 Tax=Pseudocercospora eumusae TaxID=321146 RepID=A0A139H4D7_9PEZI|nr:hypothetical protein AC578_2851 [Pseudocercospora eumusae]
MHIITVVTAKSALCFGEHRPAPAKGKARKDAKSKGFESISAGDVRGLWQWAGEVEEVDIGEVHRRLGNPSAAKPRLPGHASFHDE